MQSIGVWRPNGVGDGLLAASLLASMRETYPTADIHVWCHEAAGEVLLALELATTIGDHRKGMRQAPRPLDALVGFDWDMRGLKLMAEAAEIEYQAWGEFIAPAGLHQTEHQIRVARQAIPQLRAKPRAWHSHYWFGHSDPVGAGAVVIHLTTTMTSKRWPQERYVELAGRLAEDGYPVVWLEGPLDNYGELPHGPVVSRSLLGMASLLAGAALYVGNDTGPTHLAGLLGIPAVAIFGGSQPKTWAPVGDVQVVQTCERELATDQPLWCHGHDCFRETTVDLVWEACSYQLGQARVKPA